MSLASDGLEDVRVLCSAVSVHEEGDLHYLLLPSLVLPDGSCADGLLCLSGRDGYSTRLFLSRQVSGKGNNWSLHRILDKIWHTWSWNGVPADLPPIEILMSHLDALR